MILNNFGKMFGRKSESSEVLFNVNISTEEANKLRSEEAVTLQKEATPFSKKGDLLWAHVEGEENNKIKVEVLEIRDDPEAKRPRDKLFVVRQSK